MVVGYGAWALAWAGSGSRALVLGYGPQAPVLGLGRVAWCLLCFAYMIPDMNYECTISKDNRVYEYLIRSSDEYGIIQSSRGY
jgi:hypothetical protein